MVSRIMVPKGVYILIPRTYDYLLTWKKDFEDIIKDEDLGMRGFP